MAVTSALKSEVASLRIIIVGAGMGGLASALSLAQKGFKDIHVYENAPGLGFVGAGIQMAPNLVRILSRLGCWDSIEADSTDVVETSIRDGASNKELAHVQMPHIRKLYGYPHCTGHRASLAGGLYNGCLKESAIKFHFGSTLLSVDAFEPGVVVTIKPCSGDHYQVQADILIAADGVKSTARDDLLKKVNISMEAEDTGQAAYRILLSRDKMASDPEMMALLDSNQVTRWIGEKRHWICYPIAGRSIYNMSSIQPDVNFAAAPSATYTTQGSKQAMLEVFSDFCPVIQRMLSLVPDGDVCEWKLRMHKVLPVWSFGSVVLVGDACHPTLPHLNQGAAQAIEDAAVLGEVLSNLPSSSPVSIHKVLKVYELVRKDRVTALVDLAASSGRTLHLGDGEARKERDKQFAAVKGGGKIPDKWASPEVQEMIYSFDCQKSAQDRFAELYHSL